MTNLSKEETHVIIGLGSCGLAAGGKKVLNAFESEVNELSVKIKSTGCVGMCSEEVLVDVVRPGRSRVTYGPVTPSDVPKIVAEHIKEDKIVSDLALFQMDNGGTPYENLSFRKDVTFYKHQVRNVLARCGILNPEDIEEYVEDKAYEGLRKAITEMKPEDVIDEVKTSNIRGRGGAGFPTGMKWGFCRNSPGDQKYIICNADEGDPGAFMDRSVLEGDPHSVIEGMMIGGYAIGSDIGIIYVRAEYPLAIERLNIAISQAKEKGFLGKNIMGSDFSFEIKIKKGAGAFVCGEETALMISIEGCRGMPRPRPPFPAAEGLWKKPTNINNVETWANIPKIVLNGGSWYSSTGTDKSRGTKVFALTGKINKPGLIEVPMGISLREIVHTIGGGIPNRKKFKAAQMGGPSGGCIPTSLLDTSVDYDSLTSAGAIMGSGGVVIMDNSTCMVDVAKFFLAFTQDESCGKCVPCRIGTRRMLDILQRITSGEGKEGDIELLQELGHEIKATSLCGLGQTAPNPVLSTIRYFRDEYEAHINENKCPAGKCGSLVRFEVQTELCKACGLCIKVCPEDAISDGIKKKPASIELEKCVKCSKCIDVCPFQAIC